MHITEYPWNSISKTGFSDSLADSELVPLMHVKPKVWKETTPPTLHLHRAVDVITHACQLNPSHATYKLIYLYIWLNVPKCKYSFICVFCFLFVFNHLFLLIYLFYNLCILFAFNSFILLVLIIYVFIYCFLFNHFLLEFFIYLFYAFFVFCFLFIYFYFLFDCWCIFFLLLLYFLVI